MPVLVVVIYGCLATDEITDVTDNLQHLRRGDDNIIVGRGNPFLEGSKKLITGLR